MKSHRRQHRRQTGASYLELLIAAVLIALLLVPMMDVMRGAASGADQQASASRQHFHLTAKLEEILGEPFGALEDSAAAAGNEATPTSYSDAGGSLDRRLVFLSLYDGDDADADSNPFTGVDAGLMWVRVEIENTPLAIETLVAQ